MSPARQSTRPPGSPRSYGVADLRRLIELYLACIDAEDRRSLRLPLDAGGRSYIAPWTQVERLLHAAAESIDLKPQTSVDLKFLTSTEGQAGAPERFLYGFPALLDENDYLTPLFMLDVEVTRDGEHFRVLPLDPNALFVNRHLLNLHRLAIEEQQAVEDMMQKPSGSFAARAQAVFEYLDEPLGSLAKPEVEALPPHGRHERRWINCPILFRSARSAITDKLRRELGAFLRYPRLLNDAPKTALAPFLGGLAKATGRPLSIVEVVPLNPEQTQAAADALSHPLTVITGPPGTGKSQVVIDLLASCAAAGKPVLFCSRNNKAVDVVRERIRELLGKEHDWTLRLGNRHHMDATKEEMTQRIDTWEGPQPSPRTPDFDEWDHQVELAYRQRQQIGQMQDQLDEAEARLRDLAGCLPDSWISGTPAEFRERLPLDRVTALRDRAARLSGQGSIGLWLRLARWLSPRRLLDQLQKSLEELLGQVPAPIASEAMHTAEGDRGFRSFAEAFARLLGFARWLEARDQVDDLQSRLARLPTTPRLSQEISDAKRARSEAAASWLRDAWTARVTASQAEVRELLASFFGANDRLYAAAGREFVRRLEEFAGVIRGLGEHLPVWIVTNLSVRRSLPLKPALFDLVIIDEASQCDIASALPLLYRAKRAVIIGDPHQLRHITVLREPEEVELARQCSAGDLLDDWSYVRHSVYDLAARATRRAGHEPIFLREHFRSWPLIAEFSNRRIYQSRLRLRTDLQRLRRRLDGHELGIVWHPVRGNVPSTQRSAWNPGEVQAIRRLLQDWWDSGFLGRPDLRFGIVTPFRLQVDRIGELLRQQPWWPELDGRLLVGTAHQFQGDECDVMIFSPVVSAGMRTRTRDWLTHTEHLLNVAITRARAVLHVVGDRHACVDAGGLLGEFGEYVKDVASPAPPASGNRAQAAVAGLLKATGLWYQPQFCMGRDRFDFLVVSPFGKRYDVEVDGRLHRTPEQIHADRTRDARASTAGYHVMRIPASDALNRPEIVQARLARLC